MWTFEVWAPDAGDVQLEWEPAPGRAGPRLRLAMRRSDQGWWRREVEAAGAGDRYGFSVDGGPLRPDPRARSLPDGVDGTSEVVDHESFRWTDGSWRGFRLAGAVLYELHVGTFSPEGTFDGVAARLPHLVELGVDAIEILPVASFAGDRGWGYDGVGLWAPHRAYDGPGGLKRLVDACHSAGLGVLLDVVYNHLGPTGNHLAEFGPYFSDTHHTNWGSGVNLDGPRSDEVRRFFIDNALMWLADYHFDGLRLDAVHALADTSARHFLEQLSTEVSSLAAHLRRPLPLIAESDLNDPRFVRPPQTGGYGLDSAWADEWHHAWHAVFAGETGGYYSDFGSLGHLAKALRQAWVYDGVWSDHRRRTHGRPPEGLTGDRFVVCTQNHDQVGNRAAGDRSPALMTVARLKVGAALLLTAPFVPMLFQGEEWAATTPWQYFTDFRDPALGRAVTDGRRAEFSYFGWEPGDVPDPQDPGTFERSVLRWEETDKEPHCDVLEWYRRLLHLRRDSPDLTDPRLERTGAWADEEVRGLVVQRGSILVAALLDAPGPARLVGPGGQLILASWSAPVAAPLADLALPTDSVAIFRLDRAFGGGDGDAGEEHRGRRTTAPPPTDLAPWTWALDR